MYDKWWAAAGATEPTGDHPFWADQSTNTRSGADTWRCKECHGWDYKGASGAYNPTSSHHTGFAGIFDNTLTPQEAFDLLKTDHSLGDLTDLTDDDIWDLAKFVREGLFDTDDIIDGNGNFTGSATAGQTHFDAACTVCHGADGLTPPPGHPEFDEYPGVIANDNPWEFQHKVSYGQPGTAMPPQVDVLTVTEIGELGAFAQSLPTEPLPAGYAAADVGAGGAMYDKWWAAAGATEPTGDHPFWADQSTNTRSGADTWRCKECHGWDYKGVNGAYSSGSHSTGFAGIFDTTLSPQEAFDELSTGHSLDTLTDLTDADLWDLAKFVLEGQLDVDDIIDGNNLFIGDAANGQTLFEGTSTCSLCHGTDGLSVPPGADPTYDDYVGKIANANPQEFQHKVSFGQPGTAMPAQLDNLTVVEIGDLGAHAQTLPVAP